MAIARAGNLKALLPGNALLFFRKAGFESIMEFFQGILSQVGWQGDLNVQQCFLNRRILELFHCR